MADCQLSEYEIQRAQNITRNNQRLRELGLITALEEERSNAAAWGKTSTTKTTFENEDNDEHQHKPKKPSTTIKRKRPDKSDEEVQNITNRSRKSARLQGLGPEGNHVPIFTVKEKEEQREKERLAMIEECREARQRAALRVMEAGAEKAAKENPTATYEHCLMRVRTMTEAGLRKRIKVIERAAGKHCVVKMAIFKSCLQDEGMWKIAEEASKALERLKGLQSPPET